LGGEVTSMPWQEIANDCIDVSDAIRRAEELLPGSNMETGVDPRWQAIIALGEFIESDPGPVWKFICKWGRSPDGDLRSAVACCLLEHLLEHHFSTFIDRVEEEALADPLFAEMFAECWKFGQSELPDNANRLDQLRARIGI